MELDYMALNKHHTSYFRGYIRVGEENVVPYKGRFGVGYKVYRNNPNSSRYCFLTYYIKRQDG